MQITNNYNLPVALYNAACDDIRVPRDGVYSVTRLVGPSWISKLERELWDKLTVDVSEMLWSILGKSIHMLVQKYAPDESFTEERLNEQFNGVTISGQFDLYSPITGRLEDWKSTSVWSFMNGVKDEWVAQQNIYKWLLTKANFKVGDIQINAILRDWQVGRSNGSDYPKIPFNGLPVDIWPVEKTEAYMGGRVEAHKNPQPCTPDEKWQKADVYAVMKPGRKSAVKLHDSETIAMQHAADLGGGHHVVKRPGECTRCKTYCPVRAFCEYNIHRGEQE